MISFPPSARREGIARSPRVFPLHGRKVWIRIPAENADDGSARDAPFLSLLLLPLRHLELALDPAGFPFFVVAHHVAMSGGVSRQVEHPALLEREVGIVVSDHRGPLDSAVGTTTLVDQAAVVGRLAIDEEAKAIRNRERQIIPFRYPRQLGPRDREHVIELADAIEAEGAALRGGERFCQRRVGFGLLGG